MRKSFEDYHDDPLWSVGACMPAAKELASALNTAGIPATPVRGYYSGIEDAHPMLVADRTGEHPGIEDFDGVWTHWWVLAGGDIDDISADQFHPSCQRDYQIVIEPVGCSSYGASHLAVAGVGLRGNKFPAGRCLILPQKKF